MTNFINISICIPTYNRADLLNQTLEVLYKENQSNNIEIVISDNASTDHTDKILDKWSRIFPHFVRHRFDSNQGADLNYLKAVELASGKYCWLYGSDDLVVSGAIAKLLKEIETDCDVYIFNRVECTKDMAPKRYRSWWKIPQNRIYDFSIKSHVLAYLYSCSALGGIFSFLTSVIVRKDTWNKMGVDKSYVGSAYL
ncbi:MAG: glycosyltransferase family 2 protein, partial [Parachlamydiales bacterium]|nr:glycosyltransferase family 2 protein [Parachlamydiales bacterium]